MGTDIHGSAGLVGRNVSCVEGDGSVHGFDEEGFGDGRDGDEGGGVGEALGVLFGAVDGDFVGGGAEGFHAFVGLLAVVEGGRHAVESYVGVCDEAGTRPDPGFDGVVAFDMAVDCRWC